MEENESRDEKDAETEEQELNKIAASETESNQADLNGDGIIDEDEAQIDEAIKAFGGSTVQPPKRRKFGWVGYVFLCGVIAVGIWLIFKIVGDIDGDANSLGEALAYEKYTL